ncbi:hypothetical protein EV715DRAFT_298322 [Schizophyllum commune]
MAHDYARLADGKITGLEAIRTVRLLWQLCTSTGYHSERGRLAADAAWVADAHQAESATRAWAALAREWYAYELGVDSAGVEEAEGVLSDPTARPRPSPQSRLLSMRAAAQSTIAPPAPATRPGTSSSQARTTPSGARAAAALVPDRARSS